jgi:hypothetical protein
MCRINLVQNGDKRRNVNILINIRWVNLVQIFNWRFFLSQFARTLVLREFVCFRPEFVLLFLVRHINTTNVLSQTTSEVPVLGRAALS